MTDLITQDARDGVSFSRVCACSIRSPPSAPNCPWTPTPTTRTSSDEHAVPGSSADPIPWLLPPGHDQRDRAYRVTGTRGTSTYLGMRVLAGTGLNPRRMSNYLSDRDLVLDGRGRFNLVFSAAMRPPPPNSRARSGSRFPDDATSIVVRDYIADPASAIPAQLEIELLGNGSPAAPLTDDVLADQLTAMGWTIVKMTTLHRTVLPDLVDNPNRLVTSEAQSLGGEHHPDNLYMLGTVRPRARTKPAAGIHRPKPGTGR